MKAFLLICLLATSMLVKAVDTPQDQIPSVETDSPSFLHVQQACPYCCNGTCCSSISSCNRGVCNNIVAPYTCVQG